MIAAYCVVTDGWGTCNKRPGYVIIFALLTGDQLRVGEYGLFRDVDEEKYDIRTALLYGFGIRKIL